jgi:hypothetical protein
MRTKIALITVALLTLNAARAEALLDLQRTAASLDEVASPVPRKMEVVKWGRVKLKEVPPLSQSQIASVLAKDLNLNQADIANALAQQHKPSQIVLAKEIAAAGGKSWKDLIEAQPETALWDQAQDTALRSKLNESLEQVYADLAVLSIDKTYPASGRAPGSSKGKASSSKNQTKR